MIISSSGNWRAIFPWQGEHFTQLTCVNTVSYTHLMIVNNYLAMENLQDLLDREATPDFIKDLHRTVTEGTLEIASDAGTVQSDQNDRVKIFGDSNQIIYVPPLASELPARIQELCDFINNPEPWMHPLLKAMVVHLSLIHISLKVCGSYLNVFKKSAGGNNTAPEVWE